jgi:CMP-N-acetylneuraminic acid synthetase
MRKRGTVDKGELIMTRKVIVPVKSNSVRVQNKNFRAFHELWSLYDIKMRQLLKVFEPDQIYVSSESARIAAKAKEYGAHFMMRKIDYTFESTPFSDVVFELFTQAGEADEYAWVTVTDPMFDQFADVNALWDNVSDGYDSIVVVRELREFVLSADFRPINWNFGSWHQTSQNFGKLFTWSNCYNIIKHDAMIKSRYVFGSKPFHFVTDRPGIDIDTEEDFALARIQYRERDKK